MKRYMSIGAVLSCVLFSSAGSAQVLLKDEVNVSTWSGLYAGLNIGVVRNALSMTDVDAVAFYATIKQALNPQLTGGVQVGYRKQLDSARVSGVYGLEFSANFMNAKFQEVYGSPFALYQLNAENALKNVLLLEAVGGISAGKTFLFLAAGISGVSVAGDITNLDTVPFFNGFSVKKSVFGTAVGGGVEYALSKQFSARFKVDLVMPNDYTSFDNIGNRFQISNQIVQGVLGINYQFG